jgi:hypothetical protein
VDVSNAELGIAFDLLRKNSTLEMMSRYMLRREISPSSASSWPQWYESRLLPALKSGRMTRADVVRMIRESEEYGRQHVFLYRCSKSDAAGLVNSDTLTANAKKMGLAELLEKPRVVAEPKGLEIVDLRIDAPRKEQRALTIKAVDLREHRNQISVEKQGNREIVTYEWERDRAVNLISVRQDGLVEVRIQSYKNSLDYEKAATNLLNKAAGFVDPLRFSPISLSRARIRFVKERKTLSHLVRFADNQLRDREGRTYSMASSGRQQELYPEGSATDKSLEAFLSVGVPSCDEVNCFWIRRKGSEVPATELHTLIMGADNEFSVTGQCDRMDYDYVLSNILNLSR